MFRVILDTNILKCNHTFSISNYPPSFEIMDNVHEMNGNSKEMNK